jgi:hypothetical protein
MLILLIVMRIHVSTMPQTRPWTPKPGCRAAQLAILREPCVADSPANQRKRF